MNQIVLECALHETDNTVAHSDETPVHTVLNRPPVDMFAVENYGLNGQGALFQLLSDMYGISTGTIEMCLSICACAVCVCVCVLLLLLNGLDYLEMESRINSFSRLLIRISVFSFVATVQGNWA